MHIFRATAFANSVPAIMDRALALARHGFAVFPLQSNKRPFDNGKVAAALAVQAPSEGQGGVKLATRDPDAIVRLWTAFPNAMIGIATGAASGGLIVLDIDRKNGRDGLQTLNALGLTPPQTASVQSPSGGYHYFYRAPAGQHCPTDSNVLGDALDRRGDVGYVVDYGFDPTSHIEAAPKWLLKGGPQRIHGERHPLRDPQLAAPSFKAAVTALNSHDPNDLSRAEWIAITAQFKQAVSTLVSKDGARLMWDVWCNRYEKNDEHDNNKQWNSIRSTSGGWTALRDGSPKRAELIFGDPSQRQLPTPQPMQTSAQFGELLNAEEQKQYFVDCVLIGPENRIIDAKGQRYSPDAFNSHYGGKRFIIDSNGKSTDEPWKAATRSTLWTVPKVDATTFRPDQATGTLTTDELGRTSFNTYIPAKIERMDGDPAPFLDHIAKLIPDQSDQRILLGYMAHNAKYPGHKIPWAPVIQSTEGAGKNIIKHVMTHVMGDQYTYPPNPKELASGGGKFNDWMYHKLFLIADEIKTDDKRDLVEVLKPMISETSLEMQGKGRDQRKADNPANWMFFTNYKDAIPVHANGRRYAIFYSAIQSQQDALDRGMNDEYFNWLYDVWLGAKTHKTGLKIVANYLLNYPIGRGAISMRAPDTSSMAEAIVESRGWLETMIAEAVDEQRNGFRGGWISTAAIGTLVRDHRKPLPSPRAIGDALTALNYYRIGQAGRGYFQDDPTLPNKRARLWNIRQLANIENYGPDQGYE